MLPDAASVRYVFMIYALVVFFSFISKCTRAACSVIVLSFHVSGQQTEQHHTSLIPEDCDRFGSCCTVSRVCWLWWIDTCRNWSVSVVSHRTNPASQTQSVVVHLIFSSCYSFNERWLEARLCCHTLLVCCVMEEQRLLQLLLCTINHWVSERQQSNVNRSSPLPPICPSYCPLHSPSFHGVCSFSLQHAEWAAGAVSLSSLCH